MINQGQGLFNAGETEKYYFQTFTSLTEGLPSSLQLRVRLSNGELIIVKEYEKGKETLFFKLVRRLAKKHSGEAT